MRKTITITGLLLGIGIGVMLPPSVKQRLTSFANAMAEGLSALGEGARKWSEVTREDVQGIVAEAQFERMRRSPDENIGQPPY
ncbi:MAG: hypothetical protein ACYCVB_03060 [Bacilli bacterium]